MLRVLCGSVNGCKPYHPPVEPDDHVCLCFRVSQRKLVTFLNRERPRVASQLCDCLGAGTGCQWCVPFLTTLFEQWERGETPGLPVAPAEYAEGRQVYRQERREARKDAFPDASRDT